MSILALESKYVGFGGIEPLGRISKFGFILDVWIKLSKDVSASLEAKKSDNPLLVWLVNFFNWGFLKSAPIKSTFLFWANVKAVLVLIVVLPSPFIEEDTIITTASPSFLSLTKNFILVSIILKASAKPVKSFFLITASSISPALGISPTKGISCKAFLTSLRLWILVSNAKIIYKRQKGINNPKEKAIKNTFFLLGDNGASAV